MPELDNLVDFFSCKIIQKTWQHHPKSPIKVEFGRYELNCRIQCFVIHNVWINTNVRYYNLLKNLNSHFFIDVCNVEHEFEGEY